MSKIMGKAHFTALEAEVVKLADALAGDFTPRGLELALDPTYGGPPPPAGTRAERLHQLLGFVKQYLLAECTRPSHGENARAQALLGRTLELDEGIQRQAAVDPSARELEPRAWALAREARSLARFAHVTIARPRWPSRHVRQDARSVFVSGALPGELPEQLAREHGLQLLVEPKRGEQAIERWNQLRTADLAIFRLQDVSGARPDARGGARARLANTCYELGIALTLGLSILIVADEDSQLPFAAAIDVLRVGHGAQIESTLLGALEDVAFGIHWGGDPASARTGLDQTLEFARRHFTENIESEVKVAWAMAAASVGRPHEFVAQLERFLSYCKSGIELLCPAWPATYPKRDECRCFHGSASANWADVAGEVVRDVCREQGAAYSRGIDTHPAVLRAIYGEVASASHVVLDLTNLDASVALELGIAHTLGKPCLLVHDTEDEPDVQRIRQAFPAIAGDRVYGYAASDRYLALEQAIHEFLRDTGT